MTPTRKRDLAVIVVVTAIVTYVLVSLCCTGGSRR